MVWLLDMEVALRSEFNRRDAIVRTIGIQRMYDLLMYVWKRTGGNI